VERAELEGARAHPFGPGTVDADGELGGRVDLAGDLDDPGREPDLLLLGEAEALARRGAMDEVPDRYLAPIARDDLADVILGEPEDGVEVSFPEPQPVGLNLMVEPPALDGITISLDERSA